MADDCGLAADVVADWYWEQGNAQSTHTQTQGQTQGETDMTQRGRRNTGKGRRKVLQVS